SASTGVRPSRVRLSPREHGSHCTPPDRRRRGTGDGCPDRGTGCSTSMPFFRYVVEAQRFQHPVVTLSRSPGIVESETPIRGVAVQPYGLPEGFQVLFDIADAVFG